MATLAAIEGTRAVLSDGSAIELPEGATAELRPDAFSFPAPEGYVIQWDGRTVRLRMDADADAVSAAVATLCKRGDV